MPQTLLTDNSCFMWLTISLQCRSHNSQYWATLFFDETKLLPRLTPRAAFQTIEAEVHWYLASKYVGSISMDNRRCLSALSNRPCALRNLPILKW